MNNIEWYRNIKLSNKELVVGVRCLECGEIVETTNSKTLYHISCHKKIRSERNKKLYKKKPVQPKYCIDCGKLIDENKWKYDRVVRCDYCQFLYAKYKYKKTYIRKDRDVTVGVDCIICGEFIPCRNTNKRYCDKHIKIKTRDKEITKIDYAEKREQLYKYNKSVVRTHKNEYIGTSDTSYGKNHNNKVKKTKDGKYDFDAELKAIHKMKNKTLNKGKEKLYTQTEGDAIRGVYVRDVNGN